MNKQNILDRIKELANLSSDTELANFLGIKKATLSNWRSRDTIDYDLVFSKCEHIRKDWLLTGEGEMLRSEQSVKVNDKPSAVAFEAGKGIPLIPTEAFCGYGSEAFNDLQIEEYYKVAEFKHADFLIRVKGNSMYPKYSSGDIVACKKITETLFFQWNKIYAIYTRSQGVMVKRVKKSALEGYILLVSDNEKYEPFDVPLLDIVAIALVIGVIRVE